MLVLTRKANEEIMIGDNIIVNVVKVSGGKIKFGITAPPEVSIKREENPQKFADRLFLKYAHSIGLEKIITIDKKCFA